MSIKPASAKAKGSRLERDIGARLGGKRAPLSGGAGGGDVWWEDDSLWSGWCVEAKARKQIPALIKNALAQAAKDIGIGSPRKPAAVIREDRGRIIFCAFLDDVARWVEALAEVGNGARVKALLRQARRVLEEAEEAVK